MKKISKKNIKYILIPAIALVTAAAIILVVAFSLRKDEQSGDAAASSSVSSSASAKPQSSAASSSEASAQSSSAEASLPSSSSPQQSQTPPSSHPASSSQASSSPASSSLPASSAHSSAPAPSSSAPASSSSPPASSSQTPQPTPDPGTGHFSQVVVPESAPKGDDYFADALFIGDSRTVGFISYSGCPSATYYCEVGLNVSNAMTKAFININGGKYTIPQALSGRSFGKIYIMFGINELGWPYESVFENKYTEMIQTLRQAQPNAVIYVQSVIPVTASRSDSDQTFNNARITVYNKLIINICYNTGVRYINVAEALAPNGYLPEEASSGDGIHLRASTYVNWYDYLKKHTL